MDINEIGSKDFQRQVNRYRRETRLAKVAFFVIIFILTGLVILGLMILSPTMPAVLTAVIFIVLQTALLILAYQGGFKLVEIFCETTDAFPGNPSRFSRIERTVEQACLAAGIESLDILYIKDWGTVPNAFSYKRHGRFVLVLNRRVWEELTNEEMLAVVSHEAAHMYTGDAAINSMIIPFEYVNNFQLVYKNEDNRVFNFIMLLYFIIFPLILPLPVYLSSQEGMDKLGIFVYFMLALFCYFGLVWMDGVLLTSVHAKSREYLADALTMQWTMNPEALTGAIKKIRDMMKQSSTAIFDDLLFVSGRSKGKKKGPRLNRNLEPSVDERLRNLQALTTYMVEKERISAPPSQ